MSKEPATQVAKKEKPVALVPKGETALSNLSEEGKRAYAENELSARDVILPRIVAMQPGSDKVLAGEAAFGELRETLDNRLLGKEGQPLEFLPFFSESVWVVVEDDKGNRKFSAILPIKGNEDLAFEEVIEGKKFIRTYTINVYGLIPSEIEKGEDMPYVLSFRSTSLRAGKKINTIMYMKNQRAGRDPWAATMNISVEKTKNDKGQFCILDVAQNRAASEAEVAAARHWYGMVRAGATKVDTTGLEGQEAAAPADSGGKF